MISDVEELDLVSAIWILASNDDNPLITLEGIRYRLGLPAETDVTAIVKRRPELFRLSANPEHLEAWKQKLLAGKGVPSWIRIINDPEAQKNTIQGLSSNDVFRSQFRTTKDADRSPIEIIKWGLEHLDRLRKAKQDALDASAKSWQMWLVAIIGVVGLVTQVVIAILKGTPK